MSDSPAETPSDPRPQPDSAAPKVPEAPPASTPAKAAASSESGATEKPSTEKPPAPAQPTTEGPASEAAKGEVSPGANASGESPSGDAASGDAASGDAASGDAASGDSSRPKKRRRRRRKPGTQSIEGEASTGEGQPEAATAEDPNSEKPGERAKRRKRKSGERKGRSDKRSDKRGERESRPARRGKSGRGPKTQHHATRAVEALSSLATSLLEVEGVDALAKPRWMEISVRVPLDYRRDSKKAAAATVESLLKKVHEVFEHERALVRGAVHCYFSGSSAADHCRPSSSREVFEGYSSTGRPEFVDFVTSAIERRAKGVEELADGKSVIVANVAMGRVLRTAQLVEFGKGSPVYRILGQVDAGLFDVLGADEKAAFSFQLLRGSTLEGRPRLRINPVGKCDLADLADPSVGLIIQRFQSRLDADSLRLAGLEANGQPEETAEEFALPLLQDLARQLVSQARRKGRRTEHAVERAEASQRPTAKAYDDARSVSDDQILRDDEQGTLIILGSKGRVHVFSPDARHVTSVVMTGSNIQKRRTQGRWFPAEPEERGEFRIQLSKRTASGDAPSERELEPATPAAAKPPAESEEGAVKKKRRRRRKPRPAAAGSDGETTDGRTSEGRAPEGRVPEGKATEGKATEGAKSDASAPGATDTASSGTGADGADVSSIGAQDIARALKLGTPPSDSE